MDLTNPDAMMSRRSALALSGAVGFLASGALGGVGAGGQPQEEPVRLMVAFVMRHAEAAGTQQDPPLTAAGRDRAVRVGRMLRSVRPQRVLHSTTNRARETAAEIARIVGVGAGSYDVSDPEPVVRRMIDGGGVWVLIGHSNTVPDLVRRLGGDAGTDTLPDSVYDQIFMVVRAGTGTMTVPLHS
jgi:phosphohistidine phosphatase SixA